MLFSIVVPVYNVEKFLSDCVESVLRQSYANYELLLVDDGSTDSSGSICDKYANKDSRIIVFHKQNEGHILTRRYAINRSKGQFILFLDSDDMWKPWLLQMVYDTIHEHSADLVIYKYARISEKGKYLNDQSGVFRDQTVFTPDNKILIFSEIAKGSELNNIWAKAVKREIIDINTDYTERLIIAEDLLQSLPLFRNAVKIIYRDKACYLYRQRQGSIIDSFDPMYISNVDYIRRQVYDCLCELDYDNPSNIHAFLIWYCEIAIGHVVKLMLSIMPFEEKKKYLEIIRNLDFYQQAIAMKCHQRLSLRKAAIYFLLNTKRYKALQYAVWFMFGIKRRFS